MAKVWPEVSDDRRRLHVAVSGGPDSLALLLLAHAALPGRVAAATVDHGLRPESADEARMVAQVCEQLGVMHETLTVTVAAGNLQTEARLARYAALQGWLARVASSGDALATAHHADDQAETLLMRLNRASGLAGLAGIRARRGLMLDNGAAIALVRPLLGWRRSELGEVVKAAGFAAAQDPSNADPHYDRIRIRNELEQAYWIDPPALAQSAEHLAEAWEMIEALAEREWQLRVVRNADSYVYTPGDYRLVSLEVIRRVVETLGGTASRSDIATLHARLVAGSKASLAGVLASPSAAFDEASGEENIAWHFRKEPPRNS